jgi:nucleoside phosphorylase
MSIRVLIVDDQSRKIRMLIDQLMSLGVERSQIDVALTGVDARKRLTETKYDLMILDLWFPMLPEDSPSQDGGVDLLNELSDRPDVYIQPTYIVGVTAHEELKERYADRFSESLWALLSCAAGNDEWLKGITNLVKHIMSSSGRPLPTSYGTDICVITALRDPELTAVRNLDWSLEGPYPFDSSSAYFEGSIVEQDREFSIIAASPNRMGMVASAILTTKLIVQFRPRLIIMAGICAGVRGKTNIGDLLLANPAWDWQSGKRENDEKGSWFYPDPDHINVDEALSRVFGFMASDNQFWHSVRDRWPAEKPAEALRALEGPVASGSLVVADIDIVSQIKSQQRKLLGVEMEAYGVYAACRFCGSPRPLAASIKSVCDFADNEKSDKHQAYSAYISAEATDKFVRLLVTDTQIRQTVFAQK